MSTIAQRLISITRRRDGKADRGALANLRRGLSETTRHYAWPVLASVGLCVEDENAVLVAALFAEHPCHTEARENFGATWRDVYHKNRKPAARDEKDSYQMRFRRLISADRDELDDQLLAIVRLAAKEGIAVNYDLLYNDLRFWDDRTKLRWAKQFHAVLTDDESEEGK